MYKRDAFPNISMALGTLDYDAALAPMGMPPPQTWADLRAMDSYIEAHFPFARTAPAADHGTIRTIDIELHKALGTRGSEADLNEHLPAGLQTHAANMLRAMHILQPEKIPTNTQGVTGAIVNFANRAKALMF